MSLPDVMRKVGRPATIIGGYRSASAALRSPARATGVGANAEAVSEIDDWEFAGGGEEDLFDGIHPTPRTVFAPAASLEVALHSARMEEPEELHPAQAEEEVEVFSDVIHPKQISTFGPVPSVEEAAEATRDLKDALENVFSSSKTTEENSEIGVGAPNAVTRLNSVMPNHVAQVFSLLKENPEAQDVVVSLASDKNIWSAVMNNEKLVAFYQNHRTNHHTEFSDICEVHRNYSERSDFGYVDFMQIIRLKVEEMVSNLSTLFQQILGTSPGGLGLGVRNISKPSDVFGASLMALAIATIMVILVRRG